MIELTATLAGILFGAIGALLAVSQYVKGQRRDWEQRLEREIARKVESEKKAYAAEHDFQHLKRNQEQMKQAIAMLQDELEETTKVLIEIRTSHNATHNRVENLAARFDNSTSGFNSRQ